MLVGTITRGEATDTVRSKSSRCEDIMARGGFSNWLQARLYVRGSLAKQGKIAGYVFHRAATFIAWSLTPLCATPPSATEFARTSLGLSTYEETLAKLSDSQRAALDELVLHRIVTK